MTLSDFATLSTAVSGIAVTASLIYLAMQTHQNSKHTRALLQQGQANRIVATLVAMSNADAVAAWIAGNGGTATPDGVKNVQFAQLCNALVADMQDFHNQYSDGLASGEQFGSVCVAYAEFLQQPGVRAYWKGWRQPRLKAAPRFIAWVDGLAKMNPAGGDEKTLVSEAVANRGQLT
jgi:hypothetical protein